MGDLFKQWTIFKEKQVHIRLHYTHIIWFWKMFKSRQELKASDVYIEIYKCRPFIRLDTKRQWEIWKESIGIAIENLPKFTLIWIYNFIFKQSRVGADELTLWKRTKSLATNKRLLLLLLLLPMLLGIVRFCISLVFLLKHSLSLSSLITNLHSPNTLSSQPPFNLK